MTVPDSRAAKRFSITRRNSKSDGTLIYADLKYGGFVGSIFAESAKTFLQTHAA